MSYDASDDQQHRMMLNSYEAMCVTFLLFRNKPEGASSNPAPANEFFVGGRDRGRSLIGVAHIHIFMCCVINFF